MKKLFFVFGIFILFSLLIAPLHVHAVGLQNAAGELQKIGEPAFGTKTATPLPELVGRYIRIFLGFLGVIFAILVIYGGYTWMTSFGNEQKVTRGKELIIDATIGLVIVLAAYAISSFVVGQLMKATTT